MRLDAVRRLRAYGFSLVPLKVGSKQPAVKWQRYQTEPPTEQQLTHWFGGLINYNCAIILGAISGVVVVDTDTPEAEAWVASNLPPTPMMTVTSHGFHRYYRFPLVCFGEALIPAYIKPTPTLSVEVKRDGHYVLAPGSVHPSGHVYREVAPWPADLFALPELPEAYRHPPRPVGISVAAPGFSIPRVILQSERHLTVWKLLRSLKARGIDRQEALAFCHAVNEKACQPPIAYGELDGYLKRGWTQRDQPGYHAVEHVITPEPTPRPSFIGHTTRGTEHAVADVTLDPKFLWEREVETPEVFPTLEPADTLGMSTLDVSDEPLETLDPHDLFHTNEPEEP